MSKSRIVLLSRDTEVRDLLVAVVGGEGYRIDTAFSGTEALQKIEEGDVAIAVLDLTMLSIECYVVYKALRSRSERERPGMVLLVDDTLQYQPEAAGRVVSLEKPFFTDQLVNALRGLLDEEGLDQEIRSPVASKDCGDGRSLDGRVVAVYGPKGGIGKTFIALNLAAALSKASAVRVAIVDGDLQCGEVAARLRLPADRNMHMLSASTGNLTPSLLRKFVLAHRSGVDVIAAPPQPWHAEHITADLLVQLLRLLKACYPFVVVDTHSSYDHKTLVMLEQADDILVVTTQDQFARRHALSFLSVAQRLGYSNKVRVVLNMYDIHQQPSDKRLEKALRSRLIGTIRFDPAAMALRESRGDPVVGAAEPCMSGNDLSSLAHSMIRLVELQRSLRGKPVAPGV